MKKPRHARHPKLRDKRGLTQPRGRMEAGLLHRSQALQLLIRGYNYREIATALNLALSTAHHHVKAAVRDLVTSLPGETAQWRAIENARLDRYLQRLEASIAVGDPDAINTAVRISKRRAELYGLDVPVPKPLLLPDIPAGGGGFVVMWSVPQDHYPEPPPLPVLPAPTPGGGNGSAGGNGAAHAA